MTSARPKVEHLPKPKILQCAHVHVSNNRCGSRSPDLGRKWTGRWHCVVHESKFEKCQECYSMLRAFQPPNGW